MKQLISSWCRRHVGFALMLLLRKILALGLKAPPAPHPQARRVQRAPARARLQRPAPVQAPRARAAPLRNLGSLSPRPEASASAPHLRLRRPAAPRRRRQRLARPAPPASWPGSVCARNRRIEPTESSERSHEEASLACKLMNFLARGLCEAL